MTMPMDPADQLAMNLAGPPPGPPPRPGLSAPVRWAIAASCAMGCIVFGAIVLLTVALLAGPPVPVEATPSLAPATTKAPETNIRVTVVIQQPQAPAKPKKPKPQAVYNCPVKRECVVSWTGGRWVLTELRTNRHFTLPGTCPTPTSCIVEYKNRLWTVHETPPAYR